MCPVRLVGGKKVLGRQRQPFGGLAAIRDPDDAFRLAPLQQLGGRGVQRGHSEGPELIPAVGEASFCVIFSFFAIFQVLQCAFPIFHVF